MKTDKSVEQRSSRRWIRIGVSAVLLCLVMFVAAAFANKEAALSDAALVMVPDGEGYVAGDVVRTIILKDDALARAYGEAE